VFTPALLYSSSISIHPTSNYSHRNMKTIQDASKAAQLDLIMSALLDAPEELLDAITTHLAQSDVLSLALTCKALWRSTSPRIFRAISMTWDANEIRPSAPRITSLLRALVKCPRNAARIEHVELQACNFEPYGDREDEAGGRPANCRAYRLLASDRPAFERDLTRMGLGNVDAWMSAIFVEKWSSGAYGGTAHALHETEKLEHRVGVVPDRFPGPWHLASLYAGSLSIGSSFQ
jgi:hypothetical protein